MAAQPWGPAPKGHPPPFPPHWPSDDTPVPAGAQAPWGGAGSGPGRESAGSVIPMLCHSTGGSGLLTVTVHLG